MLSFLYDHYGFFKFETKGINIYIMSNTVTIHKGDGWLMRPTLESRNIDIEEILVQYSQVRKPW